jgi:RimJ/RimL family protein N-acetyltransferase
LVGDSGLCVLVRAARQAELGITLARAFQGRGLAGETMSAVLDYAFINLDLHRVFATLDVENKRSAAPMERVGLRREGRFVKNAWFKGHWADEYLYAVLQAEWLPRHGLPAGRGAWQRSETRHHSCFLSDLSARRQSAVGP